MSEIVVLAAEYVLDEALGPRGMERIQLTFRWFHSTFPLGAVSNRIGFLFTGEFAY